MLTLTQSGRNSPTWKLQYRSALGTLRTGITASAFNNSGTESAEHREAVAITRKADLGTMVAHIMSRRNTSGAESEAQEIWGLDGNQIPMAMLAEIRTVAAPDDGGGTVPVNGYMFPASIAQFANIARPTVPAGTPVYPSVITAGAAGRPAEGAAHGSTEPTLRGQLLAPKRVQAFATLSVEDRARFPSLGPALAAHLAASVAAGMDEQALSDDNGFFDSTNGPLTVNGTARSSYAHFVAMVNDLDGQLCQRHRHPRWVS